MPIKDNSSPIEIATHYQHAFNQACVIMQDQKLPNEEGKARPEAIESLQKYYPLFFQDLPLHFIDDKKDLFEKLQRTSLKIADIVHRMQTQQENILKQLDTVKQKWRYPKQIESWSDFHQQICLLCQQITEHLTDKHLNFYTLAQHLISQHEWQNINQAMQDRRKNMAN